jgi:glycogen debranching enzyme
MADAPDSGLFSSEQVKVQRWPWSLEHGDNLDQPYVTAGNRVYSVATQHGEFPEIGWRQPSEMSGVWDPPIKLLDGFWLGITFGQPELARPVGKIHWLTRASRWRMIPGQIEMTYQLPKLEVIRREYGVDDYEGLLIRLELRNGSRKPLPLTLHFLARTDLRLAWLGKERLIWRDGRDEAVYLDQLACIAAYNTINPAYVLFGAQRRPVSVTMGNELWATQQTEGQGISGRLSYGLNLPAGANEEIIFTIAGSTHSREDAVATFRHIQAETEALCERQQQRYGQLLTRCALHSGDELMDTAFGWAKVTLQMLERNVPGTGQGIAAGLPDHPWWIGNDTAYAALPLVASGQFDLALNSLRNLARYSETVNGDGAVVHEILTQGHVHDNGLLVEIPLFVRACYHAFRWTGDRDFLQEVYGFCKRGLLEVVLGKRDLEGNLCGTGRGLVETRELQSGAGMKTLDIAAYTYGALLHLAELAEEVGDGASVPALLEKAQLLCAFINTAWWIEEEGLYGDIYISADALSAAHRALRSEKRFWPGDLAELEHSDVLLDRFTRQHGSETAALRQERPWLLKHMIAATPIEVGLATPERAERVLKRLESDEFNGPWGIYLNPETQRVTMTLPNSLMAAAEAQYGRMDQALAYCHKIASTLAQRMPGTYSEVSPDEGCFIQAWSSYGLVWPVVHFFLGFRPDAANRRAHFIPHLPVSWQNACLQDVRVGSASFDLSATGTEQTFQVTLETNDPSYEVTLGCVYPVNRDREPHSVTLNGTLVSFTLDSIDERSLKQRDPVWCTIHIPSVSGLHRYQLLVTW